MTPVRKGTYTKCALRLQKHNTLCYDLYRGFGFGGYAVSC